MNTSDIIDAVRAPRGRGKPGKGARSSVHPQELVAQLPKHCDQHREGLSP